MRAARLRGAARLTRASAGTFDLLVYTDKDIAVPGEWEDSDPRYISTSSEVRLRSFTTKVHKIDAMVSYYAGEE